MTFQPITLHEVCALVERHGVSPADAAARYYAGRTDAQLARAQRGYTYNQPRLRIIAAEVERRHLAARRKEVALW